MTDAERESLIRSLTILMAANEPGLMPDPLDADTYVYAFKAGARSALADCITRLRDIRADAVEPSNVVRIGGTA